MLLERVLKSSKVLIETKEIESEDARVSLVKVQ